MLDGLIIGPFQYLKELSKEAKKSYLSDYAVNLRGNLYWYFLKCQGKIASSVRSWNRWLWLGIKDAEAKSERSLFVYL